MMHKRSLFVLAGLLMAQVSLFGFSRIERFDSPQEVHGILRMGGQVIADRGVEKGGLVAQGNGNVNQNFYIDDFAVTVGKKYVYTLQYKTSAKLKNQQFIVQVIFYDGQKKQLVGKNAVTRLACSPQRFTHCIGEFMVPEGAVNAKLMLRLISAPASEWVVVDNLRLAEADEKGWAKNLHLEEFETNFDPWDLDHHLIFERFGIADGGEMVHEWKEAKVGEVFFRVKGTGKPMQYSMWIDNLNVRPSQNYVFEAFYKATEDFKFNGHGILIFFYRNKSGKTIGQSRFHIRPTNGQWAPVFHAFTTPKECVLLDIGLNTRNMKANEYVCLDHLRFYRGAESVQLTTSIDPEKKTMSFLGNMIGVSEDGAKAKGALEIFSEDGKQLIKSIPAVPGKSQDISISGLKDGLYQMRYRVELPSGKSLSGKKECLAIFNHPDWFNDIGIQEPKAQPPQPWKPLLAVNKTQIQTWQNLYAFQENLMLEKVGDILSQPVRFTVNDQEGKLASSGSAWKVLPSLGTNHASLKYPSVACDIECSIDYTGFTRYRVTLTAKEAAKIASAKLSFALKELAFLHRSDDSWTQVGAVVLKKDQRWTSKHFYNEFQVGTEESGLVFYAPKLYPAVSDFSQDWVTVDQGIGKVSLELVNAPLELAKGKKLTLEFALASYPFRPVSKQWQTLRFRGGKDSNMDLVWQTSSMFKYAGSLPCARNDQDIQQFLAKSGSVRWLFYQFPFYILDAIPQWRYFEKQWRAQPSRAYDLRECSGGMGVKGDIRKRSWQDLYMKEFQTHLSKFKWAGVYYDCFGTDVFRENGETFHPTFETRQFQERIYCEQRRLNPDTFTLTHLGAAQFGTAAAFADAVVMGEQYRAQFAHNSYYTQFMTLEEFRAENCVKIGPARMILPQYRQSEQMRSPAHCTHVVAMALAHNLMLYPNFIDSKTQLNIRGRLYAFGLDNATFHPYWKQGATPRCVSSNPQVKISYYQNAKGIFATVLNPTAQPQKLTIKTDPGLNMLRVYDSVTDTETPFDANKSYTIQPYMALFLVSPAAR